MTMTDPIADLLTRVRNSVRVRKKSVDVPASKLKSAIVNVLVREGFVDGVEEVPGTPQSTLRIKLRYDEDGMSAIQCLTRESKPGRRQYRRVSELPRVLSGMGIAVLSTPKGVLSDREARRERVGGEYLCSIY